MQNANNLLFITFVS